VPRRYPAEFRRKVLDLVAAGRPVAQVAYDLQISAQTIYTWRQREHEIHPRPEGQQPQPALHRPGLRQHVIDQLERQALGQLTQMAGSEHAPGGSHGTGDRSRGRLSAQRDLWRLGRS
jgi:transposase-like protein